MSEPDPMETLSHAIERLNERGFRKSFHARADGLVAQGSERVHAPEDLLVEEVVRFEGISDPEDEAVLFALASRDGAVRGTFVSAFGIHADPLAAEMMRRLDEHR